MRFDKQILSDITIAKLQGQLSGNAKKKGSKDRCASKLKCGMIQNDPISIKTVCF